MKIKFIKEYVSVDPATNSGIIHRFGETEEIEKYTAQWLIDNGFAEEVKESGWWKPKIGEGYFFLSTTGEAELYEWENDEIDKYRYSVGNVFKTEKATERCHDYLKAIAIVRQGEGVLTPEQIYELGRNNGEAYHIGCTDKQNGEEALSVCEMDLYFWPPVGAILFDTEKHAQASLDKHRDEWKIIANYDWSRE